MMIFHLSSSVRLCTVGKCKNVPANVLQNWMCLPSPFALWANYTTLLTHSHGPWPICCVNGWVTVSMVNGVPVKRGISLAWVGAGPGGEVAVANLDLWISLLRFSCNWSRRLACAFCFSPTLRILPKVRFFPLPIFWHNYVEGISTTKIIFF